MSLEKLKTESIEESKAAGDGNVRDVGSSQIDLVAYYETNAGRLVVDPL